MLKNCLVTHHYNIPFFSLSCESYIRFVSTHASKWFLWLMTFAAQYLTTRTYAVLDRKLSRVTSHRPRNVILVTPHRKTQPRIFGFHRKYLILSSYMFSAWFYTLFVRANLQNTFTYPKNSFTPIDKFYGHNFDSLLSTDEQDTPLIPRTAFQNKVLLRELTAL